MPLTEGCQLIAIVFSVISAAAPKHNSTGQQRAIVEDDKTQTKATWGNVADVMCAR